MPTMVGRGRATAREHHPSDAAPAPPTSAQTRLRRVLAAVLPLQHSARDVPRNGPNPASLLWRRMWDPPIMVEFD